MAKLIPTIKGVKEAVQRLGSGGDTRNNRVDQLTKEIEHLDAVLRKLLDFFSTGRSNSKRVDTLKNCQSYCVSSWRIFVSGRTSDTDDSPQVISQVEEFCNRLNAKFLEVEKQPWGDASQWNEYCSALKRAESAFRSFLDDVERTRTPVGVDAQTGQGDVAEDPLVIRRKTESLTDVLTRSGIPCESPSILDDFLQEYFIEHKAFKAKSGHLDNLVQVLSSNGIPVEDLDLLERSLQTLSRAPTKEAFSSEERVELARLRIAGERQSNLESLLKDAGLETSDLKTLSQVLSELVERPGTNENLSENEREEIVKLRKVADRLARLDKILNDAGLDSHDTDSFARELKLLFDAQLTKAQLDEIDSWRNRLLAQDKVLSAFDLPIDSPARLKQKLEYWKSEAYESAFLKFKSEYRTSEIDKITKTIRAVLSETSSGLIDENATLRRRYSTKELELQEVRGRLKRHEDDHTALRLRAEETEAILKAEVRRLEHDTSRYQGELEQRTTAIQHLSAERVSLQVTLTDEKARHESTREELKRSVSENQEGASRILELEKLNEANLTKLKKHELIAWSDFYPRRKGEQVSLAKAIELACLDLDRWGFPSQFNYAVLSDLSVILETYESWSARSSTEKPTSNEFAILIDSTVGRPSPEFEDGVSDEELRKMVAWRSLINGAAKTALKQVLTGLGAEFILPVAGEIFKSDLHEQRIGRQEDLIPGVTPGSIARCVRVGVKYSGEKHTPLRAQVVRYTTDSRWASWCLPKDAPNEVKVGAYAEDLGTKSRIPIENPNPVDVKTSESVLQPSLIDLPIENELVDDSRPDENIVDSNTSMTKESVMPPVTRARKL